MTMGRCGDCAHWTRHASGAMGHCDSEKWQYDTGSELVDGVSYADYEGYSAKFRTGENFGCVHFVTKRHAAKPVDERACRTCRWWRLPASPADPRSDAECRRHAPVWKRLDAMPLKLHAAWPDTEATEWCGDWEA